MALRPAVEITPQVGRYGPLIETRLRVLTWNLWGRFGPWERRLPAIAHTIAALAPDVVLLQEVWDDHTRNLAAILAERLGFHHAFGTRLEFAALATGNAVLSRWPIASSDLAALPAPPELEERRGALRADIDGPRGRLQVFSTHLNWRFDQSHVRQDQVRRLAAFVAASHQCDFPPVIGGDLNAAPDADEIRMLTGRTAPSVAGLVFIDAWEAAGDGGRGVTWSNDNPYARLELEPDRRIDYILVGPPGAGGAGHVVSCRVVGREPVDGVQPSDHWGVLAELRY